MKPWLNKVRVVSGWVYVASSLVLLTCVLMTGCGPSKTREQIQREQKEHPPLMLYEVDGVRLYRIYDKDRGQTVYFTAPSGDVQWTVPGDDDNPPKHFQVPGAKRK